MIGDARFTSTLCLARTRNVDTLKQLAAPAGFLYNNETFGN